MMFHLRAKAEGNSSLVNILGEAADTALCLRAWVHILLQGCPTYMIVRTAFVGLESRVSNSKRFSQ